MVKSNNRKNAYQEAYTILQELDEKEYLKIPPEVIQALKENRNEEYYYEVDEDTELKYQPMLPETKAILFNIFRDYLATPEQKEKIKKMISEERAKLEIKKKQQYNPENIFKSNTQQATKIEPVKETEALVKVKKENWFKRAIEKIKSWFKKNEL